MLPTIIYICVGLLLLGVAPLPYGYYMLLRLVACGVFALASFIAHQKKHAALPWVYGLLAILFNPFFPVYLTKELWMYMDIGAALLLLFTSKTIIKNEPKSLVQSSPTTLTKGALAGSDYEHAIPVNTVEQEYAWIETNHPNAIRTTQEVLSGRDGLVDVLVIELPDGSTRKVYFDITGIFAKYVADLKASK